MTEPMRMEEDQSHMTERILTLTLEIIYLLTGESFPLLKCGEQLTITVPPCDSLKPERHSMQKILEVTQKMIELLTGESDYKAEVKKEIKVEDGVMVESSSYKKPLERCPRLLYSHRDPPQEDLTIPHLHRNANLGDQDIIVKEEYKEEDEEYGVMKEPDEGPKDVMEPPNKRKPPERCPRPQDPTQEGLTIPQGDLIIVKVEAVEDETEDIPTQISTGSKMEDKDVPGDGGPSNPSEQPRTVQDGAGKTFPCAECGKCCRSELGLSKHEKSHLNETFHPCPDCGKRFRWKSELITHQRSHTGEKPYTCSECGNSFTRKSSLVEHEKLHRGEKPFSCTECGKCFINKYGLSLHQRTHTGEKPYACEECGKCFPTRARLCKHQRIFPGDQPHFCLICGKCFARKTCYTAHQISHTQENPASSS